ncbi:MAG: hypothetical protein H6585_01565 [Flavobacteriales bacterium]|nr:hypothetical protein [Flavobacteriales bacterium]MCB9447016.1 hypothetical protein [Flavobacteriales bacterium]
MAAYLVKVFLNSDLVVGFGLYSLLYIITRSYLRQKEWQAAFDRDACRVVSIAGLLWFLVVCHYLLAPAYETERRVFVSRLTGPYWFAYGGLGASWFLLTQLLWFRFLRRSSVFRILISTWLISLFYFEYFVIWVTSLHRDFLPSSWSTLTYPLVSILYSFLKLLEFLAITLIFHIATLRIRRLFAPKRQQHPHAS